MKAFIYKISNTVNDRVYIGATNDAKKRRSSYHWPDLRAGRHPNLDLQKEVIAIGIQQFRFEIMEEFEFETRKERDAREAHWYNQYADRLYNAHTYPTMKGFKHTEETCEKNRQAKLGCKLRESTRRKISRANIGRPKPEGFAENLSKSRMGSGNPMYGRKNPGKGKKILCVTTGETFDSAFAAAEKLGISHKHIGSVCNGNRKHTHGFVFKHL